MQKISLLAISIAMVSSTAYSMEPMAKEQMCNNLGAMMYGAAFEASNRLDRDIFATTAYKSVVTLEDPQGKRVWGPYFNVAQEALRNGKDVMSASLLSKAYCVEVN